MDRHNRLHLKRILSLLFIIGLLMTGCSKPTDQPPVPSAAPLTQEPVDTPTAIPTAAPARMLLLDPFAAATAELNAYLAGFAEQHDLTLETQASPELPALGAETKVVLLLAELPGLDELTATSPETQFILIGNTALNPAGNLSVIQTREYDLTFMAGYLAQSIAWDWRTAGLIPSDTALSEPKTNAFINGARYLCGVCTPFYAPIVSFPMLAQEPAQADAATWSGQVSVFGQHFVNTYFVDPAVATVETLDGLKGLEPAIFNDVKLIGISTTPNPERFTALIGFDPLPALEQLLPQLIAGNGGLSLGAQVKITSFTDDTVITPAKIDNFNRVAADLAAGMIVPLSIP